MHNASDDHQSWSSLGLDHKVHFLLSGSGVAHNHLPLPGGAVNINTTPADYGLSND